MSLAAFERSGIAVRLISVVFGFDLGRAVVVTFFVLGSCRWRLIIFGASGEPIVVASDGVMRSSTRPGCVHVNRKCLRLSLQGAERLLLQYAVGF